MRFIFNAENEDVQDAVVQSFYKSYPRSEQYLSSYYSMLMVILGADI